MDKSIKIGNLCIFRKKNILSGKRVFFFCFLQPTNENMKKKIVKKSLFWQNFFIQIACIIVVKEGCV